MPNQVPSPRDCIPPSPSRSTVRLPGPPLLYASIRGPQSTTLTRAAAIAQRGRPLQVPHPQSRARPPSHRRHGPSAGHSPEDNRSRRPHIGALASGRVCAVDTRAGNESPCAGTELHLNRYMCRVFECYSGRPVAVTSAHIRRAPTRSACRERGAPRVLEDERRLNYATQTRPARQPAGRPPRRISNRKSHPNSSRKRCTSAQVSARKTRLCGDATAPRAGAEAPRGKFSAWHRRPYRHTCFDAPRRYHPCHGNDAGRIARLQSRRCDLWRLEHHPGRDEHRAIHVDRTRRPGQHRHVDDRHADDGYSEHGRGDR